MLLPKGHQIDRSETSIGIYLQGQLITLHKDPNWFSHELASHLQDLMRKGGRYQNHLVKGYQIHDHISSSKSLYYFLSSKTGLTKRYSISHSLFIQQCGKCSRCQTGNKIIGTEQIISIYLHSWGCTNHENRDKISFRHNDWG
jgi:hypothetical protein